jgi:hypothetical protein
MKNVQIWIPKGRNLYYAKFSVRDGASIRHVKRCTGTPDERVAQRIANQMRNLALEDFFELPKLREDGQRCGRIVDRYLAHSVVRNKREVASDFLRVAAVGAKIDRNDARDLPLSRLTADAMIYFRDRGDGRTPTTTNSLMRSARSIFSMRAMEHYRDLAIPKCVHEWRRVAYLKETHDHSFHAIPPETLTAMDHGADMMLRLSAWHKWTPAINEWKNAWACYWLMRLCGLRNSEVEELRWHWISERDKTLYIDIIERKGEFRPKAASGSVPLDKGLHGLLVELFGPPRDGAHVLLGTKTDREVGCLRRVNDFVRRYLPDRVKGAYELRKQYGSEMAAKYGIETAAKLLRHRDIKTAWSHYYDSLKLSQVTPVSRT